MQKQYFQGFKQCKRMLVPNAKLKSFIDF